jgi:CheY-like chemotaxis protein
MGDRATELLILHPDRRLGRAQARQLARELGVAVLPVETAVAALAWAAAVRPNIVLAPLDPAEIPAAAFVAAMRARVGIGPVALLAVAPIEEDSRSRALVAGFDDFIGLPIEFEALVDYLRRAVACVGTLPTSPRAWARLVRIPPAP